MIGKFLKTTWTLWMDVPGKPPLWKCVAVALLIATSPQNTKMGSTAIDILVESDIEEAR